MTRWPWAGGRRTLPRGLWGRAPDARELSPRPTPREIQGQVQHDTPGRALDPHGELDEPLAQRRDLGAGTERAGGAP
jgi:hypothetical protein